MNTESLSDKEKEEIEFEASKNADTSDYVPLEWIKRKGKIIKNAIQPCLQTPKEDD